MQQLLSQLQIAASTTPDRNPNYLEPNPIDYLSKNKPNTHKHIEGTMGHFYILSCVISFAAYHHQ
jgi:hypothetical protein